MPTSEPSVRKDDRRDDCDSAASSRLSSMIAAYEEKCKKVKPEKVYRSPSIHGGVSSRLGRKVLNSQRTQENIRCTKNVRSASYRPENKSEKGYGATSSATITSRRQVLFEDELNVIKLDLSGILKSEKTIAMNEKSDLDKEVSIRKENGTAVQAGFGSPLKNNPTNEDTVFQSSERRKGKVYATCLVFSSSKKSSAPDETARESNKQKNRSVFERYQKLCNNSKKRGEFQKDDRSLTEYGKESVRDRCQKLNSSSPSTPTLVTDNKGSSESDTLIELKFNASSPYSSYSGKRIDINGFPDLEISENLASTLQEADTFFVVPEEFKEKLDLTAPIPRNFCFVDDDNDSMDKEIEFLNKSQELLREELEKQRCSSESSLSYLTDTTGAQEIRTFLPDLLNAAKGSAKPIALPPPSSQFHGLVDDEGKDASNVPNTSLRQRSFKARPKLKKEEETILLPLMNMENKMKANGTTSLYRGFPRGLNNIGESSEFNPSAFAAVANSTLKPFSHVKKPSPNNHNIGCMDGSKCSFDRKPQQIKPPTWTSPTNLMPKAGVCRHENRGPEIPHDSKEKIGAMNLVSRIKKFAPASSGGDCDVPKNVCWPQNENSCLNVKEGRNMERGSIVESNRKKILAGLKRHEVQRTIIMNPVDGKFANKSVQASCVIPKKSTGSSRRKSSTSGSNSGEKTSRLGNKETNDDKARFISQRIALKKSVAAIVAVSNKRIIEEQRRSQGAHANTPKKIFRESPQKKQRDNLKKLSLDSDNDTDCMIHSKKMNISMYEKKLKLTRVNERGKNKKNPSDCMLSTNSFTPEKYRTIYEDTKKTGSDVRDRPLTIQGEWNGEMSKLQEKDYSFHEKLKFFQNLVSQQTPRLGGDYSTKKTICSGFRRSYPNTIEDRPMQMRTQAAADFASPSNWTIH